VNLVAAGPLRAPFVLGPLSDARCLVTATALLVVEAFCFTTSMTISHDGISFLDAVVRRTRATRVPTSEASFIGCFTTVSEGVR